MISFIDDIALRFTLGVCFLFSRQGSDGFNAGRGFGRGMGGRMGGRGFGNFLLPIIRLYYGPL